uniref:Uncharacterized protein n=1 Tax=uncultured prokaryote TaxID=198431 RepID=A0A0H5Q7P7_9ZZZZ|nr:hypothetical protein [uncultured prokaryote]
MYEILTDWQSANSPGGTSVMYLSEDQTVAQARSGLNGIYAQIGILLDDQTTATIRTEGKVIDATTGNVTEFWSDNVDQITEGLEAGVPVPNVCQGLVRLLTDGLVNNRRLQGRVFIPGISEAFNGNGELSPDGQTILRNAFNGTYLADAKLLVWSRPFDGTDANPTPRQGSSSLVDSTSVWSEFAVQRRRR